MKYAIAFPVLLVLLANVLAGAGTAPITVRTSIPEAPTVVTAAPTTPVTAPQAPNVTAAAPAAAHAGHPVPIANAKVIANPTKPTVAPVSNAPDSKAPVSTTDARTAYINAMYLAVVPARERAALAGRYVLGYNLPGLSCGTGCTGLFDGQARSSFNNTFFAESSMYQRNTLAHEAAHAYGFLYLSNYATPSWAGIDGWQDQFHAIDRGFVKTYDAEAWAACVAWQETGFNDRIDQISNICTPQAAALAMAHIG